MNKLILGLIGVTLIVAVTLWFQPQLLSSTGLDRYIQIDGFTLADPNSKKCTKTNGEVIYGTILKPEDCLEIVSVDTYITVVESPVIEQEQIRLSDQSFRNTSDFNCDGRTHCSEMTSCAEAHFYLDNCTNMQVDGDQDGIPCERQWC